MTKKHIRQNVSSPAKIKSKAAVLSQRYRPTKKRRKEYQFAFNTESNTKEYRKNMLSMVNEHELALAASKISQDDEDKINNVKKKRKKSNKPKMSISAFAGLKLSDIII